MKKRPLSLIIGNWKTNPGTQKEAITLIKTIEKKLALKKLTKVGYSLAVPNIYLSSLLLVSKCGSFGIENVSGLSLGASTGFETSSMAKSVGATFAVIGHSEVRARGEESEMIAKKVQDVLKNGMSAVLCIGEEVRDQQGSYLASLEEELKTNVSLIDRTHFGKLIIAYEPVWAIGKDTAATPSECFEAVIALRRALASLVGIEHAKKVAILYGGTVTKENAKMFIQEGGVDGLLIGRSSLDANAFVEIISNCTKK